MLLWFVTFVDDCTITTWVYLMKSNSEVAQSNFGVVMSQRKYALDILEETGMLDWKLVDTPMNPNVKLIPGQEEPT